MMIAEVGGIVNVSGSRIATPFAPPRPGSTPMMTPSMMPTTMAPSSMAPSSDAMMTNFGAGCSAVPTDAANKGKSFSYLADFDHTAGTPAKKLATQKKSYKCVKIDPKPAASS